MNPDVYPLISAALADVSGGTDSRDAATGLLAAMGYRSDRRLNMSGDVDDFLTRLPAPNLDTQSERDFRREARSARVLFQLTNAEIAQSAQRGLFDSGAFDKSDVRSFMFAAVDLRRERYARGRYAAFTREINKRIGLAPVVVLFRTASDLITLAFAHRRQSRTNPSRQVIGSVSLVREIDPRAPHRAHLDILAELSLDERLKWMQSRGKPENFDGLLKAWLAALDTEELNKQFYKDLFAWFQRAVQEARFPTGESVSLDPEEHVIRLITRLLFVWFVKEKGLVDEDLFIEERVAPLLRGYDRARGDSYYRAVLQNLFFATLNTEIAKRGFSAESNATHRDFSKRRYQNQMNDPDALANMFARTPFINGGLFDCLDSFDGQGRGGYRVDCFSDVHWKKTSVPNRLFFDKDGLIPLFERYKFTVEENTPTETEVALDPELLGKAFENLLAANTPETRDSARKQTGSYYTPRPVVDYMVDEALSAALARALSRDPKDADAARARLRRLFDYEDAFEDDPFSQDERRAAVRAVSRLRVLDPAVGSGAFPMGVLHKLTLALRRLDPDNALWQDEQKAIARNRAAAAFDTPDQAERNAELQEISDTFERYRDSDFGRKLYLIQNSVFGVDIQQIAAQIAKLRFFISLAIEQEANADPFDNYGVKPLPNLETRFVAANTLIGLEGQGVLPSNEAERLRRAIHENRERYFHATERPRKIALRQEDAKLRRTLAAELVKMGFPRAQADHVSAWDPYDQNASSGWFDPEYMFGVADGFDVVIGNPPYIQLQRDGGKLGRLYQDKGFQTYARTGDIYQLFYEKGCGFLARESGILSYITSNSWMRAEYGKKTRRYFSESHAPLQLIEMGKDVFENAIVDTNILILRQGKSGEPCAAVDMDRLADKTFPPSENLWGELRTDGEKPWSALSSGERSIMDKMESVGTPLKDWDVKINYGIKTGYNAAFIIDDATKRALILEDPNSAQIIKPVLRGRDVQRYREQWAGMWIIDTHNGHGNVPRVNIDEYPAVKAHLDKFYPRLEKRHDKGNTPYNLRNCTYHDEFAREKLFWIELVENGRFAYSESEMYGEATTFVMTGESIKYLCAVLNASVARWFLGWVAPTSGMGTLRWKKAYVETIPIPKIPAAAQRPYIELVERILTAKDANPSADTSALESEIDALVYALYGLTADESAAVERG